MSSPRALVLDCQGQHALSAIRSLHAKGVDVTAAAESRLAPGLLSKHVDERYVHPPVRRDYGAFVDHLVDHLERRSYLAVFAFTDVTSTVLSKYKPALERTGTTVAVEDWERFRRANDKARLTGLYDRIAAPCPETHAPAAGEVADLAREVSYPVVVKPRRTTTLCDDGTVATTRPTTDDFVHGPAELRRRWRTRRETDPPGAGRPLVQEYVEGQAVATVALANEGDVVATFQHTRERTYPAVGGRGAISTGIREPAMADYAREVVAELGWTGPIHVEFQRTPDGRFYLIEVNGRYWGSLPLTIHSGVDVPWLHYRQLAGETFDEGEHCGPYRTDVRQRKLFATDLLWLAERLSEGEVAAVGPFCRAFLRTRAGFISPTDPLPLVGACWQTAVQASKKGLQTLA